MLFRAFQSWVCFSFASLCLGSFCGPVPAFADTLEDLLQEVKIPTLPSRTRDALDFLVAQKGFGQTPAHEVIQQLQNRQALNCVVVGGPIQIPISYPLQTLDDLLRVEADVKQQQFKDRYRPDYGQAQQLFLSLVPPLQQRLQQQEQQVMKDAVKTLEAFKGLNHAQKELQNQLSETQQYLNQMLTQLNALTPAYQQAKAAYEQLNSKYQGLYNESQRVSSDLADLRRRRPDLVRRIQAAWAQVSQAESMIIKDPANVKIYRERIVAQRKLAQYLEKELRHLDADVHQKQQRYNAVQGELAGLKPYYEAAIRRFEQEKTRYAQIEDTVTRTQKTYAALEAQSKDISQKQQENQAQQAQWVHLIPLLRDAQVQTQQVLLVKNAQNYDDYVAYQAQHLLSIKSLLAHSQDSLYTGYFGEGLAEALLPLRYLTEAMQKPPLPVS